MNKILAKYFDTNNMHNAFKSRINDVAYRQLITCMLCGKRDQI